MIAGTALALSNRQARLLIPFSAASLDEHFFVPHLVSPEKKLVTVLNSEDKDLA